MITKGIVESIDGYKAVVRIPIFDKAADAKNSTNYNDLSTATICVMSKTSNPVNVGDVVFVGFEDHEISKPIILGHLFRESMLSNSSDGSDIVARVFSTTSTTRLYKDTYIGDIKPNEIGMLTGLKANVQLQLNDLENKITGIDIPEVDLSGVTDRIDDLESQAGGFDSRLNTLNSTVNNINLAIYGDNDPQTDNKGLVEQIEDINTDLSNINEDINSIDESITSINNTLSSINMDNIRLKLESISGNSISLSPSIYSVYSGSSTATLTITLNNSSYSTEDTVDEYVFQISMSSNRVINFLKSNTTLRFANGWESGEFEGGYTYVFYILNNIIYVSYIVN